MSDPVGNPSDSLRINVSRDALRADLAEMELRLKSYIALELDKKAPAAQFERLAEEVYELKRVTLVNTGPVATAIRRLEEGEFSQAHKLAINQMIDITLRNRSKDSWSWKERGLTIMGTIVAIAALYFSAVFTLHSTHSVQFVPTPTTTSSTSSTTTTNQGSH